MEHAKFYNLIEIFWNDCLETMKSKGKAYSGTDDVFGNFKRCAKLSGTTQEKVWYVYFIKHFDALSSYIRGEYCDSEPIKGRIKDLINYLLLLSGMISEDVRKADESK